ncbi:hypothetical protein [Candidatus Harpocratesius sp.]
MPKKKTTSKKRSRKKTSKKKGSTKKKTKKTTKSKKTTKQATLSTPKAPKSTSKKTSTKKLKKKSSKKMKKTTVKKKKSSSIPKEPVIKEVISIGDDLEEQEANKGEIIEEEPQIKKWWLEEPYRSLLDPDLAKTVDFTKFDLSSLIEDFTAKMVAEELIDFRISGLAIYSSAQLYHTKITGVIKQEEEIQKAEMRERIRRQIPKAIAQPLREARKIATSEELFGAMRRAIIETMQKREKLRIRREQQKAKREKEVRKRGKGRLPAEILKHITGSEETIEERLKKRHRQLVEIVRMENPPDRTISMKYFKKMIYNDQEKKLLEKKVKYIQTFEEMLFLASLGKVVLHQNDTKSPLYIKLVDQTSIEF